MPNQSDSTSYSHCVVQWEEKPNNNQLYAIVDTKRAKTVSALKVGITIVFEGYQRERRRGKILYLGSKRDCFTFSFDVAESDDQVNFNSWSVPPGLREQSDEISQALRSGNTCSSSFQRTTSSSSTSSITVISKEKGKKVMNKNSDNIHHPTTLNDKVTPPPPPPPVAKSTITSSTTANSTAKNLDNQSSNTDDQSSATVKNSSSTTGGAKSSIDLDSALEEIKKLREQNMTLMGELTYVKENSIPIPSEECYQFLKSICSLYEKVKSERNQQAIEVGKKLPCSEAELQLAKKTNPATTINNLVKYCLKGEDLKNSSYDKLKVNHTPLLKNIHDYVNLVHAPRIITQTQFSGTVSLKCRHLREGEKLKKGLGKPKKKKSPKKKKFSKQDDESEKENVPEVVREEVVEDIEHDGEDEDLDEMF